MQKIKPRSLAGFLELTPSKQVLFTKMKQKIENVFILNGLSPMDTPVLEHSEILLAKAGGETEKQIYRFEKGDNDICMRFDLTVPFAKYCAIYQNELIFPFRRYQIGKVYRGERTQMGRLREFYQCDVDIINPDELSISSDAECIDILSQIYDALGYKIAIKVSNRKILNGIFSYYGLDNVKNEIFNIIDKKEKIGKEKTLEELEKLAGDKATKLLNICDIKNVAELQELATTIDNEEFKLGLKEIEELFEVLKALKPKNIVVLDLNVIRGLDYYTGTVFEANLVDLSLPISVGGGGRYDNLAEFYTDKKLCGVGVSVGLSRLFDLLDKNGLLNYTETSFSKVAIVPLGDTTNVCYSISKTLKENGIANEVLAFNKSFKNKLNYVNKRQIPFMMVVGDNEVNTNTFGLKDMRIGQAKEFELKDLINYLKNQL